MEWCCIVIVALFVDLVSQLWNGRQQDGAVQVLASGLFNPLLVKQTLCVVGELVSSGGVSCAL